MIKLRSSDGVGFKIEVAVAKQSKLISGMIEDDCVDDEIPIPNVNSKILSKVIEYLNKHAQGVAGVLELRLWDAEFVKVDQSTLFSLILAANYLDIKSLLLCTCQAVADIMKGKNPDKIRAMFNIENDYTPEEEEEVQRENQWAFN